MSGGEEAKENGGDIQSLVFFDCEATGGHGNFVCGSQCQIWRQSSDLMGCSLELCEMHNLLQIYKIYIKC